MPYQFAILIGENIVFILIAGFLSGAVATLHLTPTSIVVRWVWDTHI
jgi:hypothetical protein